jgi:hypothetical protein
LENEKLAKEEKAKREEAEKRVLKMAPNQA